MRLFVMWVYQSTIRRLSDDVKLTVQSCLCDPWNPTTPGTWTRSPYCRAPRAPHGTWVLLLTVRASLVHRFPSNAECPSRHRQ